MDMEKAYDGLERSFVHNTFIHIGFPNKVTNITMKYICIMPLSILINGYPIDNIILTRGISTTQKETYGG